MKVVLLRAPQKPPQTAALFIFGSTTSVNKHDQFLCDPELAGVCGLWQSFFQLTMFTGKLSDVLCGGVGGGVRFGRPGLSEYCRWHRSDRSAASCGSETPRDCQTPAGRERGGSCGAQEGFDLRPQRELYHNNMKPKSLKGQMAGYFV